SAGGERNFERRMQQFGQRRGGFGGAAGAFGNAGRVQHRAPEKKQKVLLLDAKKKLETKQVRTGIRAGPFTRGGAGSIKTGDDSVVGLAASKVEGPAAFGGGMGGPGGRPGGGGPPQRGR